MSLVTTSLMDPDTASPPAELHLPAPYGRLFTNGDMAYVAGVLPWNGQTEPVTVVQVADLTNRTSPTLRGSVALPTSVTPAYDDWYWGYGDEVAQVNGSTLAFHQYSWGWYVCDGCPGWGAPDYPPNTLYFVDMSNPDHPTVASTLQLSDWSWSWGLKAIGSTLYLPEYRASWHDNHYWAKYYLERFDASNPAQVVSLGQVNVPGQFISASGNTIYTLEQSWDDGASTWNTWLHALQLVNGSEAELLSTVALPGWVDNVIVSGNTAFCSTDLNTPNPDGSYTYTTDLLTVDLTNPSAIAITSTTTLPVSWGYLQSVQNGLALFGMYPGIIAYDVSNPWSPVFKAFYRTEGWSEELVVDGSNLFVPSGDYGVQIINLQ
jgi:hypothetical protein